LHDLPDEQRAAVELAYYQAMSHREIAEYLSIPLGTVKTRIRLGMDRLRRIWLAPELPQAVRSVPGEPDV
jgi:RNA polymerase sigma-70 factor (ECF subfamily)